MHSSFFYRSFQADNNSAYWNCIGFERRRQVEKRRQLGLRISNLDPDRQPDKRISASDNSDQSRSGSAGHKLNNRNFRDMCQWFGAAGMGT